MGGLLSKPVYVQPDDHEVESFSGQLISASWLEVNEVCTWNHTRVSNLWSSTRMLLLDGRYSAKMLLLALLATILYLTEERLKICRPQIKIGIIGTVEYLVLKRVQI